VTMAGKLVVFEGTDGSGKSTQFQMACQALEAAGQAFDTCVYPQYNEESSALVRMYLDGRFGARPFDVNPFAASSFYAVDRYAGYKKHWGGYYESGGLVVLDRYTTSNAVHQSAKMSPAEREPFFRWLEDFEYSRLGLPRPAVVIWLDTPIDLVVQNILQRERATHAKADIHETDIAYLTACREAAAQAAAFYGWRRVDCATPKGSLRSKQDIHKDVMAYFNL